VISSNADVAFATKVDFFLPPVRRRPGQQACRNLEKENDALSAKLRQMRGQQ
jgi:hypothetical protein